MKAEFLLISLGGIFPGKQMRERGDLNIKLSKRRHDSGQLLQC